MSEERKNWYEGLTASELEGKHVHVTFSNGAMDGCLNLQGMILYWISDNSVESVQILEQGEDKTWHTVIGVESVTLVWDERDWEQIRTDDVNEADAIVVNGRLLQVDKFINDLFMVDYYSPIPASFVSCALRRKPKLPTKRGYYQSEDGNTWLLDAGKWNLLMGPYYMMPVSPKEVTLPLTPIFSVDGKINHG